MAELKPKVFFYKRAIPEPPGDLQSLLKAAFSKHATVGDRLEEIEKTGQTRFVTLHRSREGILFGVMICYTVGNNQPIVGVDLTQKELSLQQIEPPADATGRRNEFIEGTLYFGVRENHVILVQSAAFRSGQFQDHINWLLRHKLPQNQHPDLVRIVDVVPAQFKPTRRISGVKTLTIRAPIEFQSEVEMRSEGDTAKDVIVRTKGKGIELIKKAVELFSSSATEAFGFEEALETGDVEVTLQVKYKKRGTDERSMLDSLAAKFSHVDDDNFKMDLEVPGLGTVGTDTLRVRENFRVETLKGLPDPASVFKLMWEWLETLAANNTIS
jgi:hypothetical protein